MQESPVMQSHTLEKIAALEASAAGLEAVVSAFQGSTLDEFGELLLAMPSEQFPNLSRVLPAMAPEEIQTHWTGSCGISLLKESLAFVGAITHSYEVLTGRSVRDADVLDFGCGWGRLLRLMLYFVPPSRLYGCDAWEKSLLRCCEAKLPVRLEQSAIAPDKLPFADASFDLIYAFSVFTHLSEPVARACLLACHKALRPDGVCVITVRPREFWEHTRASRPQEQTAALLHDHDSRGFAFMPAPNRDDYGDTTITQRFLEVQFPAWRIVKLGRALIDPFQVLVWMRPA